MNARTTPRTTPRTRAASAPAAGTTRSRRRVLAAVASIAFVLLLVLGILLASGDGDGDGSAEGSFGPVAVDGVALAPLAEPDPAVGAIAPNVLGRTPAGEPIEFGLASAQPTLLVFLAHWCPHCQAEVPVLVRLAEQGAFDGVRLVAVLTATNPDAPNFPPEAWLEREGWPGEVLLDDEASSARAAYGEAGFPFLVAVDVDGVVVGRTEGEQPAEVVSALVDRSR